MRPLRQLNPVRPDQQPQRDGVVQRVQHDGGEETARAFIGVREQQTEQKERQNLRVHSMDQGEDQRGADGREDRSGVAFEYVVEEPAKRSDSCHEAIRGSTAPS